MYLENDEPMLALYENGKYFAGLPFFEKFRYDLETVLEVDCSSAGGDLLKMTQLDARAAEDVEDYDDFARVPIAYYEELQEILAELIPDFCV